MNGDLPFSTSLKRGQYIFISGKIGMDPSSGLIVKGDVAAQTQQIFLNLAAELSRYNAKLDAAVKTTVFLTDMRNFDEMNAAYRSHFGSTPPARSCVSVTALPNKDALVEIEMIAYAE